MNGLELSRSLLTRILQQVRSSGEEENGLTSKRRHSDASGQTRTTARSSHSVWRQFRTLLLQDSICSCKVWHEPSAGRPPPAQIQIWAARDQRPCRPDPRSLDAATARFLPTNDKVSKMGPIAHTHFLSALAGQVSATKLIFPKSTESRKSRNSWRD